MKSLLKKTLRITGRILLGVFIFTLLILLLLQIPAIQTFLGRRATSFLEGKTGGTLYIGKIDINFIDRVTLKDVLVKDPHNDTVLYAGELQVGIALHSLLFKTVSIKRVDLENAVYRLTQNQADSTFNFQFLIDAFASKDTTPKPKPKITSTPWEISVGRVSLTNVKALIDLPPHVRLDIDVGYLLVNADKLDITKKIIKANNLRLDNTTVNLTLYASTSEKKDTVIDSSKTVVSEDFYLPDIGWDFEAGKVAFKNVAFSLNDLGTPVDPYGYDPLHMQITNVNFHIEKAAYVGQTIHANILDLTAMDRSGLQVKRLKTKVLLDPCGMTADDIVLETGESQFAGNMKIGYDDYNDLLQFKPGLSFASTLKGYVGIDDVTSVVHFLVNDSIFPEKTNARLNLDWKFSGDISNMVADRFNVSMGNSTVINTSFKIKGFPDLHKTRVDLNLANLSTAYGDIDKYLKRLHLPKGLGYLGTVKVTGHVQGLLDNLAIDNLLITSMGAPVFKGNARVSGLPYIDTTRFDVNVEELNVLPPILMVAFDQNVPDEIKLLGKTSYHGTYNGTIYDMALRGTVSTELGSLDADLQASFVHDYSNATYKGNLQLIRFDVGKLISNKDVGQVSLLATVDGQGFSLDQLSGKVDAFVQQASYKGYPYKAFVFNGTVDKKEFNGQASINDSNLKFNFNGLVDFNDSIPRFRFSALLDTINLGKLHLTPTNYALHSKIDVNFQGLSLDHFLGTAVLHDIRLSNDSLSYQLDSFSVHGRMEEGRRKGIRIVSPVLNARVRGEMKLSQLSAALVNYFDLHFPLARTKSEMLTRDTLSPQDITLQVTVSQPLDLIRIFAPKLSRFDTASITGSYNSSQQTMELHAYIPGITYDSISIDTVRLNAKGDKENLAFNLALDSANDGSQLLIPYIHFNGDLVGGAMNVGLAIAGDSTVERLFMGGKLSRGPEHDFIFSLKDSFFLTGSKWKITPDNMITFGGGILRAQDVILTKKDEQLKITSANDSAKAPPLSVSFSNFNIRELSDLVNFTTYQIDGMINGGLTLQNPLTNMAFTADVSLNDLVINKIQAGDLSLKASKKDSDYSVALVLAGADNDLSAKGTIANDFKSLDVELKMPSLKLQVLEPFLKGAILESKGTLSADVKVNGNLSAPDVNGKLGLHGISTKVKELNTRLALADNEISINPSVIKFPDLKITDEKERTAILSGVVNHDHFKNIAFNLNFNTPAFGFLNTTEDQNNFYYGTLVMSVKAAITGNPKLPVFDVTAKTLKGTKFFISPSRIQNGEEEASFVIFHSPTMVGKTRKDTFIMAKNNYEVQSSGIDLTLNFEMTPDAELQVVVDPSTGDKLVCHGSALLSVQLPPIGAPEVTGTYTIDTGTYSFSYQKLLKRDFFLQKGGHIDFSGDPMEANLDINAMYSTLTTTYELLAGQVSSLSSEEIEEARRRTKIAVVLNIRGQILEPDITFDIQLPADQQDITSSMVARQLALIKQDQSELDKQVFGLLVFNSFFADQGGSGGSDVASTGANLALGGVSSVSSLINSELNKLANKVQGLEVNLNVGSYVSNAQNTTAAPTSSLMTEAQLAVSQHLFNDRLVVTLGGNLDLENVTSGQSSTAGAGTGNGSFSNAGGDFTLEYKLTPNGRYRVKVFQSTNYDILQGQLYKTGVGFSYQRSFGHLRKKKKGSKTSPGENKEPPVDTSPNSAITQ